MDGLHLSTILARNISHFDKYLGELELVMDAEQHEGMSVMWLLKLSDLN
jgi:hypothetical protein